jgi:hypothetical protein
MMEVTELIYSFNQVISRIIILAIIREFLLLVLIILINKKNKGQLNLEMPLPNEIK